MPDSLEQLQADAKDVRDRGMAPDRFVLRAIALGYGTRKEIREATEFDYAAIEKALERESGVIRSKQVGQIERFSLASENGNGTKSHSFVPALSEKKPPTSPAPLICESCGGPRSPGSGKKCRKCHTIKGNSKPIDPAALEEAMATQETVEKACKELGVSTPTLYLRRKSDPAITAAMERGRKRYYQNAPAINVDGESEDESPVAYIEEKSEPTEHDGKTAHRYYMRPADPIVPESYVMPVNVRVGIQGNKAWLETDGGAVIANIEIVDIQFSTVFDIKIRFKFKPETQNAKTNIGR